MKLFVISDIHGSVKYASIALEKFNKAHYDNLVILGDLYYHGPRNPLPEEYNPKEVSIKLNAIKDQIIAINGNCDAEVDQMISEFPIEKKRVLITPSNKKIGLIHGHHGVDELGKCDLYLTGHTHISVLEQKDGSVFANPGSISLPKAEKSRNYIIVNNDEIFIYDLLTDELINRAKY